MLAPEYREDYSLIDQIDEACTIAIRTLKKSIPLKPSNIYSSSFGRKGLCPRCGMVENDSANYCRACGQAIDWNLDGDSHNIIS